MALPPPPPRPPLTPPLLSPEELSHPNDGKTYPPVPGRDEIFENGQKLVPLRKKRVAAAAKRVVLTDEQWVAVFTEVQQDVLRAPWATSGSWASAYWNLPAIALAVKAQHFNITLSNELLATGAPAEALIAMVLRITARLKSADNLRASKLAQAANRPSISMLTGLLLRGEEFCEGFISMLDDLRVVEKRLPGCTRAWCEQEKREVFALDLPIQLYEYIKLRNLSARWVALAAYEDMSNTFGVNSTKLVLPLFASAALRVSSWNAVVSPATILEDWKVDVALAQGIPGGVKLPDRLRYGWVGSELSVPGLRLISVSETGQCVYADRKSWKINSEGRVMDVHPQVKKWGWNVQIHITAENYAYLRDHIANPPAACPWAWYDVWGNGAYDRDGFSKDKSKRVSWQEDTYV